MKISKLFHWLYAILMLLPAFAIGVTCAYAIFNKNAYQSYSDDILDSSVNVTDISQYTEGQLYYFDYKNSITSGTNPVRLDYISLTKEQLDANQSEYDSLSRWWLNTNGRIYFSNDSQTLIKYINYDEDLSFQFKGQITSVYLNVAYINRVVLTTEKLDSVFYYSIDKVQQSPLFNWAYDSFLATPITYITGLFGIAGDHIAVMLMSYWLAISVIWLSFDLVMYVPLLVHRWIDKGVLE